MISIVIDTLSWILLMAGSFFLVVGAIGLNRMPDLFSRLQATGVSDTVGAGFLLLGMMLQAGFTLVTVKLVFLLLIFLFTAPVATHAVTRAALSVGIEPKLFDSEGRERRKVIEELRRAKTAARPEPATKQKAQAKSAARKKGGPSSKR
ncbi:MAG: monovalent cation/H(+) antiporter subunit G [Mesorhizobium sp.]|nr:monovalent cation/H(+) antiporter subunit G [Mesorhizobium sp.]